MAQKKGQVSAEETQVMFGDIVDRVSDERDPKPAPTAQSTAAAQEDKEETLKVSLYLTPEEINALDTQIILRRSKTGKSPRRSHLIREAIQMWLSSQSYSTKEL
jgi:hypothetical protein